MPRPTDDQLLTAAHPGELANRLKHIYDDAGTFSDPWSEVARAVWSILPPTQARQARDAGRRVDPPMTGAGDVDGHDNDVSDEAIEVGAQAIVDAGIWPRPNENVQHFTERVAGAVLLATRHLIVADADDPMTNEERLLQAIFGKTADGHPCEPPGGFGHDGGADRG